MPSPRLSLPAPAKLNLMLHITGRRSDGYHELQTLFQLLDYGDQLHFAAREDEQIRLQSDFPGVPHDSNLIVRAARQLQVASASYQGVDIWIDKRLPMGGGIGGGSSNAATTLLALNHLWQLGWSLERLASLGLQLGADVPVFVHGHAAFAEGVGEKLTTVDLDEPWYLVVVPQVSVSTAEIFSAPELTRNTPAITLHAVLERGGHNDCQPVAEQRYAQIHNALIWLNKFVPARLTGTGSCVFGSFPSKGEADRVAAQLPADLPGFVARGSNVSMLHRQLQNLV